MAFFDGGSGALTSTSISSSGMATRLRFFVFSTLEILGVSASEGAFELALGLGSRVFPMLCGVVLCKFDVSARLFFSLRLF
jgi:hypothetical protein